MAVCRRSGRKAVPAQFPPKPLGDASARRMGLPTKWPWRLDAAIAVHFVGSVASASTAANRLLLTPAPRTNNRAFSFRAGGPNAHANY